MARKVEKSKSPTWRVELFWIGLVCLTLWVLRDLFVYGRLGGGNAGAMGIAGAIGGAIGGTVGDLRVWLLAVSLYLLYRRNKRDVR